MSKKIYKIVDRDAWNEAVTQGSFQGSGVDLRDHFIHFSAAHQVAETATKHFAGHSNLLLVEVDADALGAELKWEPSRDGDLFPHLYAALPISTVRNVTELAIDENGQHKLPRDLQTADPPE